MNCIFFLQIFADYKVEHVGQAVALVLAGKDLVPFFILIIYVFLS